MFSSVANISAYKKWLWEVWTGIGLGEMLAHNLAQWGLGQGLHRSWVACCHLAWWQLPVMPCGLQMQCHSSQSSCFPWWACSLPGTHKYSRFTKFLGKMVTAKGTSESWDWSKPTKKRWKGKKDWNNLGSLLSLAQLCGLWGATQDQMAGPVHLLIKFTRLPLDCRLL